MGQYQLELRLLKKIPARILKNSDITWDGNPDGVEMAYGPVPGKPDPWHVTLGVRSRYWTMDDIKRYIQETRPEGPYLDFTTWSATGGYNRQDVTASFPDGTSIRLSYDECQALAQDHVDARVFENMKEAWSLELPYGHESWIEPLLPAYVTEALLKKLPALRYEFARRTGQDELTDRISYTGRYGRQDPDVLGFLSDALAYAKRTRCALWACIVK